jgi:hypothetical protein
MVSQVGQAAPTRTGRQRSDTCIPKCQVAERAVPSNQLHACLYAPKSKTLKVYGVHLTGVINDKQTSVVFKIRRSKGSVVCV